MSLDLTDALVVFGVLLIAAGLWFIWPPAPLLWIGACLLVAGIARAAYGNR